MRKKIFNIKKYLKTYEEELNILEKEYHGCIKNKTNKNYYDYLEKKMNYINSLASIIETLLSQGLNNKDDNAGWIENLKKQFLCFDKIKFLNQYIKLSNKELELFNKIYKKCKNKKF